MKLQPLKFQSLLTGLLVCLVAVAGTLSLSSAAKGSAAMAKNRYLGMEACESCHSLDAAGNQFHAWKEEKHSSAFELLKSDEAIEVGKAKGIDKPWESDDCLKCHVTGFGEEEGMFKKGFLVEHGVQCETCHGPAELHKKARFRAAGEEEEEEEGFGDEEEAAPEYVEIPADELTVHPDRALCLECHNPKSPTYKHFCYYLRAEIVRHLDPRRPRTAEQLDELLVCQLGDDCDCTPETCEEVCPVPPSKLKKAE